MKMDTYGYSTVTTTSVVSEDCFEGYYEQSPNIIIIYCNRSYKGHKINKTFFKKPRTEI